MSAFAIQGEAFVTVGISNDCDYDNLFDAFQDADLNIRATSETSYTDSFIINKPKIITGGYDNCTDAENNVLGDMKSQWNGQNNGTTVRINANQAFVSLVVINNFEIMNGEDTAFAGAGGILVTGKSNVLMANVDVHNNEGNEGGGIRVKGSDARLTITDTRIFDNLATGYGGGVYCESGAVFNMSGESAIHNNTADIDGGGILGNFNCQIDIRSGDTEVGINTNLGIYANKAVSGGGIYLQGGADMQLIGNDQHPASVSINTSTNQGNEGGGGIFLKGQGTTLTATNARIEYNIAETFGGGIMVDDMANFSMTRLSSVCWDNDKCSSISHNIISSDFGQGAGGFINAGATSDISQTYLNGNLSSFATLFAVNNAAYLRLEGNQITNNRPLVGENAEDLFSLSGSPGNGASIDFFYNTLTKNNALKTFFISGTISQQTINIFNSIIWTQGDIFSLNGNIMPIAQVACSVVNEVQSLAGNIGFLSIQDPRFRNAAANDFHLLGDSSAVDQCDESFFISSYDDLNAQIRGVDTLNVANNFGIYDAGAYEYLGQNSDIIFHSDFE